MSKKIVDENGNVYYQKKPFYKKWWFWLLIVVIVVGVGSQGAGTSKDTSSQSGASKVETQTQEKNNTSKLGETLVFDKEAEITVKSAVWTEERNSYQDSQETPPKKVLVVTYDIKNLKDIDAPVGMGEVSLYVNGKKAKTYPVQTTMGSISSNRIFENATQAFRVDEEGDLELEVQPPFSFKDKKIIKLDVK